MFFVLNGELELQTAMSELRWLTFTSCCFIAYYCALLSSRSRFRQLQSSQGTRRGWATRSWWGYWWGTYRKPHIIHTHQPQHVTPNEASAAFKQLIAHCLQLSLDPLLILRSRLSSNSSWLAMESLRVHYSLLFLRVSSSETLKLTKGQKLFQFSSSIIIIPLWEWIVNYTKNICQWFWHQLRS